MQCEAITKAGTQCSRKAVSGTLFCTQHKNYTGALASGNINISAEPQQQKKTIVEVKEVKETKSPVVQEIENTDIPKLYSDLDGKLDLDTINDVLLDSNLTIDNNPDNNDILDDEDLTNQFVGSGPVMILLPVGEDPATINKVLFYDAEWTSITVGEIIESVIAEYGMPITTELNELKTKAIELGEEDILEDYNDLDSSEYLYELNTQTVLFVGLEKVSDTHAIYKLDLDWVD